MIRKPVVAGTFYPGSRDSLEQTLSGMIEIGETETDAIGIISPHAGYIYSGQNAANVYSRIRIPGRVIILGVNHRGLGAPLAVDGHDLWQTPLGDISIDLELGQRLVDRSSLFQNDSRASLTEHSLEVQVPFIQYLNPEASILPLTIASVNIKDLLAAGRDLAELINETGTVLMVASTDMSHYIDAESARKQDTKAIDQIEKLAPEGLFDVVTSQRISMCGLSPTVIMLAAARELGARSVEVVEYTNSGATSGDFDQVVGYLSAVVN